MITEGTYTAKIVNKAIVEANSGNLQAAIIFSFEADGKPQTLTYYGSLHGGAIPYTVKALVLCGLKGDNPAGPVDIGREMSIVVKTEEGSKGGTYSKIAWVNKVGGGLNSIPQDQATAKLAALEAAVAKARAENPDDDSSIPF